MSEAVEGKKLASMFEQGAAILAKNVKTVDALNVFPVPDGDTGTNMNLTIQSGIKEVQSAADNHAGKVAKSFSKGLLMGARGNSGVILSQLFRGFAKAVEKKETLSVRDLEQALEEGVTTAYKAVMKPVEGTILTVAKDAAENDQSEHSSAAAWMSSVVKKAEASLEKTPELLPVLKEVGVVDSGGQGLVYIYHGMLEVLEGNISKEKAQSQPAPSLDDLVKVEHHQNAQSHISTEDIEFGYCTEVMVSFDEDKLKQHHFDETTFRNELAKFGDSLLVVSDEDLVKIHIHAEYPGDVLTTSQKYGSLVHVKIDNMREQHRALQQEEQTSASHEEQTSASHEEQHEAPAPNDEAQYGFVTVSMGEGIKALFKGLGANEVIAGGQTMNPSTEDIMNAIKKVNAEHIFVLPNNGNIVMAAEQAADVSDKHVEVIPTKSVPEGLSAMIAFHDQAGFEENKQAMQAARQEVKTGQVTYAVRDTSIDGMDIAKGDYMGIWDKDIVASGKNVEEVTTQLLENMVDETTEIVTLIRGENGQTSTDNVIVNYVEKNFEDVEVEVHEGGQPLYSYIIAVE